MSLCNLFVAGFDLINLISWRFEQFIQRNQTSILTSRLLSGLSSFSLLTVLQLNRI